MVQFLEPGGTLVIRNSPATHSFGGWSTPRHAIGIIRRQMGCRRSLAGNLNAENALYNQFFKNRSNGPAARLDLTRFGAGGGSGGVSLDSSSRMTSLFSLPSK